jgi:LDH2 family malate/lactate/ureidoglycolate dehydrogenase
VDAPSRVTDARFGTNPVRIAIPRAGRSARGVPIDDETWREIAEAARGINVPIETPTHVLQGHG